MMLLCLLLEGVQGYVLLHILIRVYSPNLLPKLYVYFLLYGRNVNDIDLNAGGLSEAIVANQTFAVRPKFGYKLMEQFAALKKGDRFYYENAPSATYLSAFTKAQLAQIRSVTLAGLICNNHDLSQIKTTPFLNMDKFYK